jgi:ribulose-5-phosphate 4-epimerase/fuculose-1-phosphate aldolase
LNILSVSNEVSPEEWAVRVDLAACYRLVARCGWEDLVFTHISARVPGTEDQFLINPYGMFFDEITASSLVKIDQEGRKVEESPFPVNAAGFVIHSAIHSARQYANTVLYTHRLNGDEVSTQRGLCPFPALDLRAGEPQHHDSRARRSTTRRSHASWPTSATIRT